MNPIPAHFADGLAFFVGMAAVVLFSVLQLWLSGRFTVLVRLLAVVGALFVILSATPLAMCAYAGWGILLVAVLVLAKGRSPTSAFGRLRWPLAAALAVLSLVLVLVELPYHRMPRISLSRQQPIYVIGDSISAGIGVRERCWPTVLADQAGLAVTNLAKPAATVASALEQAGRIRHTSALVILEIGGNDLLGHTDRTSFRRRLGDLLAELRRGQHQVVMLELPLPPFHNAFGKAQRELAQEHGATLVPKRLMTHVLCTKGATVDGIHLSQKGHDAFAERVRSLLTTVDAR